MLQTSEIQKRFSHLQQTIGEAARTCQSQSAVPQELADCVDELNKQCQSAQSIMSSQDRDRMRQCVDKMEALGDKAERACKGASGIDAKMKQCVDSVHSELSELKHQMH